MEVCMKKLLPIILVAVLCLTVAFGALVGCNATKPVVGLIALHDENSTYDKNFIDAFKAACEEKGLKQGEYVIATNIPESEKAYQKAAELADAGCKAVFATVSVTVLTSLKPLRNLPTFNSAMPQVRTPSSTRTLFLTSTMHLHPSTIQAT